MNSSQQRLLQEIEARAHIYLDNDGFLFDNTTKMNEAAIFCLKEVFGVDPLTFPRAKALANLQRFYAENQSVFNRVPWVASESLGLLQRGIAQDGLTSTIGEFDIFRMSSRAYGGTFLYDADMTAQEAFGRFKNLIEGVEVEDVGSYAKVMEAVELFESNLAANKDGTAPSPISGEHYVVDRITSRMVFETYLGVYFALFEPKVGPIEGAYELVRKLSAYCRETGKGFGVISNRSADSLLSLLERYNFIGEGMLDRQFIIPADPVLGGKPRLHQFRQVIPAKERILYFGDLPTDVEVARELNKADGEGTAFVVVIPTALEYALDSNGDDAETFDPQDRPYAACLRYDQILPVLAQI